jgi:hypothetical protein
MPMPRPPRYIDVTASEFGPARVRDVACAPTVRADVMQWMTRRLTSPASEHRTVLVLHGPCGCGKRALVRAAAAECHAECVEDLDADASASELQSVVSACELVLTAHVLPRALFASPELMPPDKKVYLICGVDGMACKGGRDDAALIQRVLHLADRDAVSPVVLTVQDFSCDALRQLRKHRRVLIVRMDAVTRDAAEHAVATLARAQHWPRTAVDAAMRAFSGDVRQALINAQEAALGLRRLFLRDVALASPFDTARRLMNARAPTPLAVLMEQCRVGLVDGIALRCVFSRQFPALSCASLPATTRVSRPSPAPAMRRHAETKCAPRLVVLGDDEDGAPLPLPPALPPPERGFAVLADAADAWSWHDACVKWSSVLHDDLLAVPLAAMQHMRLTVRAPSFEGMFDVHAGVHEAARVAWPQQPECVGHTLRPDAEYLELLARPRQDNAWMPLLPNCYTALCDV